MTPQSLSTLVTPRAGSGQEAEKKSITKQPLTVLLAGVGGDLAVVLCVYLTLALNVAVLALASGVLG